MSVVSGTAPWYEKAGMIKLDSTVEHNSSVCNPNFLIEIGFGFYTPSGRVYTVELDSLGLKFMIEGERVRNYSEDGSVAYTELEYELYLPYSYAYAYYEYNSKYLRILFEEMEDSDKYEIILFNNGNIQYKSSRRSYIDFSKSEYNASSDNWDTTTYFEAESSANESVFITRESSTSYTVSNNSYYENDSSYKITLPTKIIDTIQLACQSKTYPYWVRTTDDRGEETTTEGTRKERTIERPIERIPVYSSTGVGSNSKKLNIHMPNGNGFIRTGAKDSDQMPIFVNTGSVKQVYSSNGSSRSQLTRVSTAQGWNPASGNLKPSGSGNYWWIGCDYRPLSTTVRNVTGIYFEYYFETNTASNTIYMFTVPSTTVTSVDRFSRVGSFSISGNKKGANYTYRQYVSFSSRSVGGFVIVPNITDRDQSYTYNLYNFYLETEDGLYQI